MSETVCEYFGRVLYRPLRLVGPIIFAGAYLTVIGWFTFVDPYSNHFWELGPTVCLYNMSRLAYGAFLAWVLVAIGLMVVDAVRQRGGGNAFTGLDTLIASFYIGAAIVAVLMFGMGYMGLYYRSLVAALSGVVVFLSYPFLLRALAYVRGRAALLWGGQHSLIGVFGVSFLCAVALFLLCLIAAGKGLFPGGGHDYYTHYFPYYLEVIKNHNIWPNDVWYHYYYSKGSGLVFLSMLLTDPLSPQVVTMVFFTVSAVVVYSLLRKMTGSTVWSLMAVVLYLAAFVWTPGYAEFEKQHVFMTSLIASVVWLGCLLNEKYDGKTPSVYLFVWGLMAVHLGLFAPTTFAFIIGFFALLCIVELINKRYALARSYVLMGCVMAVVFMSIMVINYFTTGMAEITPFRFFWQHADQMRFSKWISPYQLELASEASNPAMGRFNAPDLATGSSLTTLSDVFKLGSIRYLYVTPTVFIVSVSAAVLWMAIGVGRRREKYLTGISVPAVLFLLVSFANVIAFNLNQPVSLLRYYVFSIFLVVTVGTVLWWKIVFSWIKARRAARIAASVVAILVGSWSCVDVFQRYPVKDMTGAFSFAVGRTSIAGAYEMGEALWAPAVEICHRVGRDTRLWSFSHTRYSMAPGCQLETLYSFGLYQDWHKIIFGSPETGMGLLKKQQLNYFIVDLSSHFFDFFPYTPLFSPENIGRYLGVVWKRGPVYLLSWKDRSSFDIDDDFLESYRKKLDEDQSCLYLHRIYDRLRMIYENNPKDRYPVRRPPNLPPLKGWQ